MAKGWLEGDLPPFLLGQRDFRAGGEYKNPFPASDELDNPHDFYAQGWLVAKWRKEADDERAARE